MENVETTMHICKENKENMLEIIQEDYSTKRKKFNYVLVPVKDILKELKTMGKDFKPYRVD